MSSGAVRRIGPRLFVWICFCGVLAAETIDFRRDVQPLIEKNCIQCHGPEQQMNAFRLDRRSAAMRGGTRSVIVPGNSAASRLYLRLIGNDFGHRMPTTGPLPPEQIAVFKAWIDQGAKWPDDLANEPVRSASDPVAVRIADALRTGNAALFRTLIRDNAGSLNGRGPSGSTPLMFAVLYSNHAGVAELLKRGADPNKANDAQATPLMWAAPDLEMTRALLDHGAQVNSASAEGRTALTIAAGIAENSRVVQLLLERGANPNPKGRPPNDTTPLREAAAIGDIESMEALVAKGADLKKAGAAALTGALEAKCKKCVAMLSGGVTPQGYTSVLHSLSVASDTAGIRYALEHGANINAVDGDGRTALMYAANNDRLPLDTVKLLLEKGADVNTKSHAGSNAFDAARMHGETPILALLTKAGGTPLAPIAPASKPGISTTASAAIMRAIPLIQQADLNFTRKSGCVSCHNEALTEMALSTSRKSGFRVDEAMAKLEVHGVTAFFSEWQERLLQGMAPGGPAYILQGLHAEGYANDFLTDSIARYLKLHQFSDGHWGVGCGGSRNPLCGDEVTNTANSMRALQLYAPLTHRAEYQNAVEKAADWLEHAPVYTHEDRTFRLFGLAWSGRDVKKAKSDLLATQRKDGGWADNPYMDSTAYATGEALVALHDAGVSTNDSTWRRGIEYLLRTQQKDGSWYVRSHSYGTQPYFDNGFPHDIHQWISAAATNWAVIALALSERKVS